MGANNDSGALQASVAVRLYGPLRVVRSGADVRLPPSRKVRALMAYLVMAAASGPSRQALRALVGLPNDPRGALRWCLSKNSRSCSAYSFARARKKPKATGCPSITSTIEVDAIQVLERVEAAISGEDLQSSKAAGGEVRGASSLEKSREPIALRYSETWLIGERQNFQSLHADLLLEDYRSPVQDRGGASLHSQEAQLAAL